MLLTYMSVWITVGLTVRETRRISNMSEGQNKLHESQTQVEIYYSIAVVCCLTFKCTVMSPVWNYLEKNWDKFLDGLFSLNKFTYLRINTETSVVIFECIVSDWEYVYFVAGHRNTTDKTPST